VPHRAVAAFLAAAQQMPGFTADDRLLAITPLTFDIALLELFAPLVAGGSVELAPADTTFDPALLAARLREGAITVLQATPTTWRLLLRHGLPARSGLRALVGGEALPPDLATALLTHGGAVWNLYGPTETTVWSTAWRVARGPIRIGRPLPGTW